MTPRSMGSRLTLWYAGVFGLALLCFGLGIWVALRHSLYEAVDESLRDRVEGVRQFIEQESSWLTIEEIRDEFREHSVLGPGGDLFQVRDVRSMRWRSCARSFVSKTSKSAASRCGSSREQLTRTVQSSSSKSPLRSMSFKRA